MSEREAGQDAEPEADRTSPSGPSPAGWVPTAIRHLALGFALLVTILFTAALCSLPR